MKLSYQKKLRIYNLITVSIQIVITHYNFLVGDAIIHANFVIFLKKKELYVQLSP